MLTKQEILLEKGTRVESLISSLFRTRTSCCKTTHATGDCGAWPGWAVSVLPLTVLPQEVLVRNRELISLHPAEEFRKGQKEKPPV